EAPTAAQGHGHLREERRRWAVARTRRCAAVFLAHGAYGTRGATRQISPASTAMERAPVGSSTRARMRWRGRSSRVWLVVLPAASRATTSTRVPVRETTGQRAGTTTRARAR